MSQSTGSRGFDITVSQFYVEWACGNRTYFGAVPPMRCPKCGECRGDVFV